MSTAKKRTFEEEGSMNNQINKPSPKKQKLNDEYCKFECGRKIDQYRSTNTTAKVCCEWC